MAFLVDWLIVLAALLAATLFLCLRAPSARRLAESGRPRRIACARLLTQAVIGFWTAALIVAQGILGADGDGQSLAGFAALRLQRPRASARARSSASASRRTKSATNGLAG
ncbi:hypothetical protein [Burkholderia cenocepacia]|uniref:hypothetical protein n=1 Tax=Burkholderia cenocepacia TaxID=95486 RepID=UPI001EE6594E|nr:hypothetical protein [Burkholderia cenocepacia]